ncbi:glycosidase [Leptospira ognonensis]|uniref:Glycosidase n=1 Tax=Leptospira ognonensis TaxID=2484945 RepID=A0A4R9JWF7_9LEPT|nr:glycoside hydrolase family 130 protein [Leptospira ognonensis]TGL56716.1 glycosidase [Leptospira ognonensis]
MNNNVSVFRTGIELTPDYRRVLYRPLIISPDERVIKIIGRIQSLTEDLVIQELGELLSEFEERHRRLKIFFLQRFHQMKRFLLTDLPLSEERKLLIGAYFTQEYALESAALFNPSMIWHPDQNNLPEGSRRFILSLRATGEGHISSITFRSGFIDAENHIAVAIPTRYVSTAEKIQNPEYNKEIFERKLSELDLQSDFSISILASLEERFSIEDLKKSIGNYFRIYKRKVSEYESLANGILSLALSNYEIIYESEERLSERIIFPHSPSESNGIEDARFVDFVDDDNNHIYYATYTAYDGRVIFPQLLETKDFLHFKICTLNGPEVKNKGMALFPRKINGNYAMISRQDNENLYLMYSEDIHFWHSKTLIVKPTYPWEFLQIGNCGSPIETKAGWLVLSHGVGAMRKYSIGAFLLHLNDPTKVIGRLTKPLLTPNEKEREGYVPNVVYSCGAAVNGDQLILPYAMSDRSVGIALISLKELLENMTYETDNFSSAG